MYTTIGSKLETVNWRVIAFGLVRSQEGSLPKNMYLKMCNKSSLHDHIVNSKTEFAHM
jgi:hypothetical protein